MYRTLNSIIKLFRIILIKLCFNVIFSVMQFPVNKNLHWQMQSLQTTGKGMFIMQRNTASEKNANLSKSQTFFSLKPTHCTERWRKESRDIFHCYLNCDFCCPVANKKNYNRNPVKHLRWRFFFLAKNPHCEC